MEHRWEIKKGRRHKLLDGTKATIQIGMREEEMEEEEHEKQEEDGG